MHRLSAICRRLLALDAAPGPAAGPRERVPQAAAAEPAPAEPAATDAPVHAGGAAATAVPTPPAGLPLESAVGGIALLHMEHESRNRRLHGLSRARVGILGRPPIGRAELDELLRPARAVVADDGRKATLWLVGPGASSKRVEELRRRGRPIVDLAGLHALAEEFDRTMRGSWFDDAVRAAVLRVRLLHRALLVRGRKPVLRVVPDDPSPRMRSAHDPSPRAAGSLRPVPARTERPTADQELAAAIEAAARAKRDADPRCRLYDPSTRS
jgi:hypothetical protein